MGANSKIEWTDHTFNPWIGCSKVHAGCAHCYAESLAKRTGKAIWGPEGTRVKTSEANWRLPLKWNREAERDGQRRRVFCASLADVFEDWDGAIQHHDGGKLWMAPEEPGRYVRWRDPTLMLDSERQNILEGRFRSATMADLRADLFSLIDATPHLDWLLLTKRPENVRRLWSMNYHCPADQAIWFMPNVWLGTSVSDQATADRMIPELLRCHALCPVLFLSIEPLLGPIDLKLECEGCALCWASKDGNTKVGKCFENGRAIDWVIVGGESGPGARPMHADWARSIRDQCQLAGVPFFFKQWGEWSPGEGLLADERAKTRQGFVCPEGCFSESVTHDALLTLSRLCRASRLDGPCTPMAIYRLGKKQAGRLLDGREWNEFPAAAAAQISS